MRGTLTRGSRSSHASVLACTTVNSINGEEEDHVHSITRRFRTGLVGLLAVGLIGVGMPVAASAQQVEAGGGPTDAQYDPSVKVVTGGGDEGNGLTENVGPLPFTGFDVIAMLAVALAVTGLGLALQRAVSRQPRGLD